MSSLPSLSLGSRFWVKNCSDISTDLGTLPLSHQHPVPACWAGIFLGTGSLRQQIPFGNEFLAKFLSGETELLHFMGEEGEERSSKMQAELLWFPHGFKREAAGIEFFSESEAAVPRQTNTTRKTRLAHVFGNCDLVHSVNLLVLFTFGG